MATMPEDVLSMPSAAGGHEGRFAYIPRTLSYLDTNIQIQRVAEADALARFAEPIVILGPPGMGKTRLMENLGATPGHQFIRATSFLRLPDNPLPPTTRLVIDGLDEVAAVSEGDPLHNVLRKLLACGKPPFVLSCREAEWRGVTANLDVADDYGAQPRLLDLNALTAQEALAALTALFEAERAVAALARLDEVGLDEFYTNPLLLDFVAAIIEANGDIPETRAALYDQAVGQLRLEQNRRHQKLGLANLSEDQALDAAGAIMATMLITGIDAASLQQTDPTALPIASLKDFADAPALQAIVRSNLFRVAVGNSDQFRPLHRTVAEFVGARWLARMVEQHGNPDRAAARLLALISTDQGIPSSLRGLAAWLPRFSPTRIGPAIIKTEPYAVLRYGDPDNLSPQQGEQMLDSLERLVEFDPYFRSGHWGRLSAKGLVQPALTDKVRRILTDAATYQMRSIMFDALHKSAGQLEFTDELAAIALDTSRLPGERSGALNVLLVRDAELDWSKLIAKLVAFGDAQSTEMAISAIAKLGAATFDAPFIVRAIIADAQLTSGNPRGAMTAVGLMARFEAAIPDEQLMPLLDELTQQLLPLRDPKKWWQHDTHAGWGEVASLADFMIRRQLEIGAAAVAPEHLWDWMRAMERERDRERDDRKIIAGILSEDSRLRLAIQRLALFADGTESEFHAYHWHLNRLSPSLALSNEDALTHLSELVARGNSAEWERWMALLNHLRGDDKLIPKSAQTLARPFAGQDQRLLEFLRRKPQRIPVDEWTKKHRRSMRDRERTKQRNWQRSREEFGAHLGDIHAGELRWILGPAKAYLGMFYDVSADEPEGRVAAWLGEDLKTAILAGFEAALRRSDLPTPNEVADSYADSKVWHWIYPLLAAAGQRMLDGKDFADLSDDVLIILAIAIEHESFVENKGFKALPDALLAQIKRHDSAYARYLQLKFEPMFAAQRKYVTGLYGFLRAKDERPRSTQCAMRWIVDFPDLPLEVEQELAECLLLAPKEERDEAWRKLHAVVVQRIASLDPGSDAEIYWRSIQFTIDPASAIAALTNPREASRNWLWSLSEHLYSRRSDAPKLPAQTLQLEWLMRNFRDLWPYAERPGGVTSGDKNPSDATELLRWTIFEIGTDTGAEATKVLAELRAMPDDGYTETIQAAIAQQQRSRLEAQFRPPTFDDLKVVVADEPPRSASDVQAIVLEAMARLQERLRGDPLNVVNNFYKESGAHKDENDCRDQMLIALGSLPYGIQFHPESAMPQGNRADSGFGFGGMLVPLEAKGQWHREVWNAPIDQLDRLYASDYRASSKGIYVVFWFGNAAPLQSPPKGNSLPTSPGGMETALIQSLPADRRADIAVVVLDLTRPTPSARKKSAKEARS